MIINVVMEIIHWYFYYWPSSLSLIINVIISNIEDDNNGVLLQSLINETRDDEITHYIRIG
jgi:hypothetical protein